MICLRQLMPMWHVDSRDTLDTVSVCFGSFVPRPSHHPVFASSYILEAIKNWLVGSHRNKANVLLLKTSVPLYIMHMKSEYI